VRYFGFVGVQKSHPAANIAISRSPTNSTEYIINTNAESKSLLLLQPAAKRQTESMKKSRQLEIVRYQRHCANDYEQAQGAISGFQK
jgi:hypothetical protein